MKTLITEPQKHEIEKLSSTHADALIAYGADMYHKGLVNGAITVSIGVGIGVIMSLMGKVIKKVRSQKNKEDTEK